MIEKVVSLTTAFGTPDLTTPPPPHKATRTLSTLVMSYMGKSTVHPLILLVSIVSSTGI